MNVSPRTFAGIVFDFDGLILDTEEPDMLSWREVYAGFGLELPQERWLANIGSIHIFDPFAFLEQQLGRKVDRPAVEAARRTSERAMLDGAPSMPGVADYLMAARQSGMKTAIASSSEHLWVDTHLHNLGLASMFHVVCCRDDVGGRAKPHPAVYQAAVARLGIEPEQALALEDSPNGCRAAKEAGLICVAVPGKLTRHMEFDDADMRLESLAEMTLPALIAALGR